MKIKTTQKIFIDLTLDSLETIAFSKGEKHKIITNSKKLLDPFYEEDDFLQYDSIDVEISIQMESNEVNKLDLITGDTEKQMQMQMHMLEERIEDES